MKNITRKFRNEILEKHKLLEITRRKLKEEFIGIDKQIDEIINYISSWFLFPDLQERPVIINLWGLTGTGKTALVNRLVYYLKWEDRYFSFDVHHTSFSWRVGGIDDLLSDIYSVDNNPKLILTLDEFQNAKTIEEEKNNDATNKVIWELLDTGKFTVISTSNSYLELKNLIKELEYFLGNGIKVLNGCVITQKEFFIRELKLENEYFEHNEERVFLIPKSYYSKIMEITGDKFETEFELKEHLLKLDGYESIKYLKDLIEQAFLPKTIDCSKSVIFVIGNLDEAYKMSDNFDTDISADEFHERSLKINITHIKKALQLRFRNEHIARLGNNHIIYPAFNSETFNKIIELELTKTADKIYKSYRIKLVFDKTIKELIYKEGVFPTQGTRPVFTTIHNIIGSKLGKIVVEIIIKNLKVDKVKFFFSGKNVVISFYNQNSLVHKIEENQALKLEVLRKNRNNDIQAITAVHESGHAICSVFLMNTIPEVVYSVTANDGVLGSTLTKFKWEYISKKEILNRVAMLIGGYVAEKIIFGDEYLTAGSESDIYQATKLITNMIKYNGMGELPAQFDNQDFRTNLNIYDNNVNDIAKTWIKNGMNLAEDILKCEENLLFFLSVYLS